MMRSLLVLLAGAAVTACSENSPAPETPPADAPAVTEAPAPSGTIGGDGSALELAVLGEADVQGLEGELACSFTPDGSDGPILIARANVDPAARSTAVVKIADTVENLVSRTEGGYDAMVDGTSYGGRGLTLDVARLSEDNLNSGGEGLQYDATLHADRADGAARTWDGVWSCGP